MQFDPPQLDAGKRVCDLRVPSSCVRAKLCFNVTEPSGNLQKKGAYQTYFSLTFLKLNWVLFLVRIML